MKKILLFASLCSFGILAAQQAVTVQQYDQLKAAGQIDPHTNYTIIPSHHNSPAVNTARYSGPVQAQNISCNCLIPLDTTFQVVPFMGYTGPDYRNDDGSSPAIILPFQFNFYGTMMDSLYINNNGNISFGAPYSTFSSTAFPNTNFVMIAPFWADVDTRALPSGVVYYQLTPTHLIVKWDSVGYYAMHTNLLSSFQLIITNGADTLLPAGTNVSFCYDDMQWTSGDASGGVNGFGGYPATVGVNMGNGVDYFQVTQTDQAGTTFDGPYGNNDGVDWLDNQQVLFNTSINGNIPPLVMNNTICDTIDVYTGDTLRTINQDSVTFEMYFMTPEPTQTVTAIITSNAPAGHFHYSPLVSTNVYKSYSCTFIAKDLPPGLYSVTGSATDDGFPVGSSEGSVYIHTYYDPALDGIHENNVNAFHAYPNPVNDHLSIDNAANSDVTILNALGQQIFTTHVSAAHAEIMTNSLDNGIYFLSVRAADGNVNVIKFVKE